MEAWLFVPGDQPERIGKALAGEADRVILDWEDAVAPERKAEARAVSVEALGDPDTARRCLVRINAVDDEAHARDLEAVAARPPGAVMTAKTREPGELEPLAQAGLSVVPLIESPLGIERAADILGAPNVVGTAFGYIDYLADLGAHWGREPLLYARGRLVNAARAAGVTAILDGVYSRIEDDDALAEEAEHAAALGFTGKLVIHPRQVAVLRRLARPTDEQLAEAREILRVYREALAEGRGAVRYKGMMLDAAVVREAERILSSSDETG